MGTEYRGQGDHEQPVRVYFELVAIEPSHLPSLQGVERLILKTRNSEFWSTPEDGFRKDFTYITSATARLVADADIKLIGIDYLSIEAAGSEGHPVHVTLLEMEIVILEGIDLREVSSGDYELACLPLKYVGGTGDGAPARTVLIKR